MLEALRSADGYAGLVGQLTNLQEAVLHSEMIMICFRLPNELRSRAIELLPGTLGTSEWREPAMRCSLMSSFEVSILLS